MKLNGFFPCGASDRRDVLSVVANPVKRLRRCSGAFVRSRQTDTFALPNDIAAGVAGWISYQQRDYERTRSPVQTLERGWGSCRDIAKPFIEAVAGCRAHSRL